MYVFGDLVGVMFDNRDVHKAVVIGFSPAKDRVLVKTENGIELWFSYTGCMSTYGSAALLGKWDFVEQNTRQEAIDRLAHILWDKVSTEALETVLKIAEKGDL